MRILLLPPSFKGTPELELTGKEYNYIVKVLRLKENAHLTGRDVSGKIWNLTLVSISKNSCRLTAEPDDFAKATTDAMPENRPKKNIVLYQCLPKGRKADEIVKRATEIGVRDIVLVNSKNCVTTLEGKENNRLERYEALIKEAIQQSGSLVPTRISGPINLNNVKDNFDMLCTKYGERGLGIILHQCTLKENQKELVPLVNNFDGTVGILVGSEGGFTQEECNTMLQAGFNAVLLKSNILRCETAAIYAVSAVQTILETSC